MDTRTKIRAELGEVAAGTRVVSGYFDPLLREHAEWLAAARAGAAGLAVIVREPDEAILPWAARAALVAALGCVDVVAESGEAEVRLEEQDLELRARFVEHVRARQS